MAGVRRRSGRCRIKSQTEHDASRRRNSERHAVFGRSRAVHERGVDPDGRERHGAGTEQRAAGWVRPSTRDPLRGISICSIAAESFGSIAAESLGIDISAGGGRVRGLCVARTS